MIRKFWSNCLSRLTPLSLFVVLIFFSHLVTLIASVCSNGYAVDSLFFIMGWDRFMDFFNSMRDVSLGVGAYTERSVIYPPMANLIFLAFSRLFPDSYLSTDFDDRMEWVNYTASWVAVSVFITALALVLFALFYFFGRHEKKRVNTLVAVCAICSVGVLSGLERANLAMLAIVCTLFYLFSLERDSKVLRELGLIALAFAFSLKLYPAVFGWLLITEKRYKEAVRCIIYALLMLILPSFAFGGPICLWWIVKNLIRFSSWKSSGSFSAQTWMLAPYISYVFYAFLIFSVGVFLAASLMRKDRERGFYNSTHMVALLMALPSIQMSYSWPFFYFPLFALFEQDWRKSTLPYYVLMVLPLLPIPIRIGPHSFAEAVIPTLALLLLILCDTEAIRTIRQWHKKKSASAKALKGEQ
ncbi:MAG: DUF2029 domain-containing protein [Clostridia bacterium]|nr:DUF2029 domain-containing protein [Clostridia bacterium]